MVYLAALFFLLLIYFQGKTLWTRAMWGELAAFLFITVLAVYYTLGPLMGYHVFNPADIIERLVKPLVVYIFS